MKICRYCKNDNGIIREHQKVTNQVIYKYYICNDCNSKKSRKYRKTKNGKEVWRNIRKRQYKKHRIKVTARQSLSYHIIKGNIKRPLICSSCGKRGIVDGHHVDYNKPLEVQWLCRSCHAELHQRKKK